MYIFHIIQSLDGNVIGRNMVFEMMLFNDPFNSFISIGEVGLVRILYFSANTVSMKQCINLELMRIWNIKF